MPFSAIQLNHQNLNRAATPWIGVGLHTKAMSHVTRVPWVVALGFLQDLVFFFFPHQNRKMQQSLTALTCSVHHNWLWGEEQKAED